MNRLVTLALSAAFIIQLPLLAAPCISSTLTNYVALGAGGCSIGGTTFNNFTLLTPVFSPISASSVTLAPSGIGFAITLNTTAAAGQTFQSAFSFNLSGGSFTGANVMLTGSTVSPDGVNTLVGEFTPGGAVILSDIGDGFPVLSDGVSFGATSAILATLDFVVDGGTGGSASLNGGSAQFVGASSAVPEPSSVWIGVAVALAALTGRKAMKNNTKVEESL
jgi:hypothetical protein